MSHPVNKYTSTHKDRGWKKMKIRRKIARGSKQGPISVCKQASIAMK